MTNKIIGALALCVIALAILAYSLWDQDEPSEPTKTAEQKETSENVGTEVAQPEIDVAPEEKEPLTTAVEETTPSDSDGESEEVNETLCQLAGHYQDWYPKNNSYESERFLEEVRAWASSRGYFETEYSKGSVDIKKQSDYDYYDIEDLKEMARAGDSMANVRLAYRMYLQRKDGSLEAAQPYCERAIVDGYTALTMCKSTYLVGQINKERRKEEDKIDSDRLRELELEYLAWQGVPEALGDELGAKLNISLLGESEFEFELQAIESRTSGIVSNIEQQRAQLGIGEIEYPPAPELLVYVLENAENVQEDINACFE